MNLKHIIHIVLIIACLTGLLATSPAPAQAQTTFDCSAVTEIPQAECEALVALYNATGGENWNYHPGWLQTTMPCSWFGVTCVNNHVTQLNLGGHNLNGPIPPQLGNLSALTTLNLQTVSMCILHCFTSYNHITSLPSEIGNLSNLTALDLYGNDLTTLPPEFGNLVNLSKLSLGGNSLASLPSELGALVNLTELNLAGSHLTSLSPVIGTLTKLTTLDLSSNPFVSLPLEFSNLTNLTTLYLYGNHLPALPPEFGNLINLTTLHLAGYLLTTLPSEFGNLSSLTTLDIWGTPLTALPPEFGNLSNLTTLTLYDTSLTALPPEFGNLANLATLDLSYNDLTTLPPEFGNLANLTALTLTENPLTALPPEFGNLSNLTTLDLSHNDLTTLPPEFGNLANLTTLHLLGNALTSLPPEFGNLTKLKELSLAGNPLRGMIPAFMVQLTALRDFYFYETEWCMPPDGPIRAWLSNIPNVYGNNLTCISLTGLSLNSPSELDIHTGALFTAAITFDLVQYPLTYTWNTGVTAPIMNVRNATTDTVWLTWDTPGEHTLTVTAANEINALSITRTVFVQPVSSTIILPNAPARLTYTDTQGLPTTLDLPAGSVTQTAALLYRPQPPAEPAAGSIWRSAGHAFSLNLYREGRALPNPTFTHPLTLTLHYSEADIANVDRPADLQLMRRDAGGWQPAACGPVSRDLEQRTLSLPLCQLGEFALFGPATLTKFVEPAGFIENGDTLTYTLVFSNPNGGSLRLFDPLSPTLAWQGFVSPPPGDIVFAGGALSGALTLSPTLPLTLSFTVHVTLPQTATAPLPTAVANTAFFCPADTACTLRPSNTVSNPLIATRLLLPLILRTP